MACQIAIAQLIEIVNGEVVSGIPGEISGVEFDSRAVISGSLFVALPGENTHGHQYLSTAFEKGAACAFVEDRSLLESSPFSSKLIYVPSTLDALWSIARYWRTRLSCPVVGITGSMGKTTAKELLAQLLSTKSAGNYSKKSFNNHIGVPYTICQTSLNAPWLVLEMGMNHVGELRALTQIACPTHVWITCVAPVHIEFFESLSAIADAKFEILEGLARHGALVVNSEDVEVRSALSRSVDFVRDRKITVLRYGNAEGAALRVSDINSNGLDGVSCVVESNNAPVAVSVPMPGSHNAYLAAGAMLVASTLFPELTLPEMASALTKFKRPAMRMNTVVLKSGMTVIDDSYNANLEAMKASLRLLAEFAVKGKKVAALLGDMREVGSHVEEYHREIGRVAGAIRPTVVVTVGEGSRFLGDEVLKFGVPWTDAESPEAAAREIWRSGADVVLVKASRGVELDRAVAELVRLDGEK